MTKQDTMTPAGGNFMAGWLLINTELMVAGTFTLITIDRMSDEMESTLQFGISFGLLIGVASTAVGITAVIMELNMGRPALV